MDGKRIEINTLARSYSDVGIEVLAAPWNEVPTLMLFAVYLGRGEFNYNVFNISANYTWPYSYEPTVALTDVIALSWDGNTADLNTGQSYVAKWKYTYQSTYSNASKFMEYDNNGTAMHFDVKMQPVNQYGYVRERVHVPRGYTATIAGRYAHRYAPGVGFTITWGYASVSISGSGVNAGTSKRYSYSSPQ